MPIRVALIAAAVSLATASAAVAAPLESGQTGVLATKALACPTLAGMAKVLKVADTNFDAAVSQAVGEGCAALDKGTQVFVVEVPSKALACVRPSGAKSCVWTAQSRITALD